jgi:hypothetical protein
MTEMENPWLNLPMKAPYFLECDLQAINKFHRKSNQLKYGLKGESLPEPYVGDLSSAKVILLAANPGHSLEDESVHQLPAFQKSNLKNLRREPVQFPFYVLDPKFTKTPAARFWRMHLRDLIESCGEKNVRRNLALAEYHPYHSVSFRSFECPSQHYTFNLLQKAAASPLSPLFVCLRSFRLWRKALPDIEILYAGTRRRMYVSRGNLGEIFERIKEKLSQNK